MTWQRARTEEQIEQRVQDILSSAAKLYDSLPFDQISFSIIAKECSFTRSNLYRYFQTREEIYLELLRRDITNWRLDVERTFTGKTWKVTEFSDKWLDTLLAHPRMVKLLSIVHTTLEKNASQTSLTTYKSHMMAEYEPLINILTKALPFPNREAAVRFLIAQIALVIGAYPMWNVTTKQKIAMEAAGMETSSAYYRDICREGIQSLLLGILAGDSEKSPATT